MPETANPDRRIYLRPGQSRPIRYRWPFVPRMSQLIRDRGFRSFSQFARKAQIPQPTMAAIMAGRPPRQFTINAILTTLDITKEEFYGSRGT